MIQLKKTDDWILVFDSGLGGLSVLRELTQLMPYERYLYFGDSANAPYGSKPTDIVRQLTCNAIEGQMHLGIKAVVVACNTATTAAISCLRAAYPDRIIVGIEPALKLACDRHPGGTIGVMATEVTLREQKFGVLSERFATGQTIIPIPCPGLVEFVEAGELDGPDVHTKLQQILKPVLPLKPDAIVLGCTHFPFLRTALRSIVGTTVEILDGSLGTALQTYRRLKESHLLRDAPTGELVLLNSLASPEMGARATYLLNAQL